MAQGEEVSGEVVEQRSLHSRVGGEAGTRAYSRALFGLLRVDEVLGPRFKNVDLDKQEGKFALAFRAASGAEDAAAVALRPQVIEYLREAHADLDITTDEYVRTAVLAGAAATAVGIEQPELGEVAGLVVALRPVTVSALEAPEMPAAA